MSRKSYTSQYDLLIRSDHQYRGPLYDEFLGHGMNVETPEEEATRVAKKEDARAMKEDAREVAAIIRGVGVHPVSGLLRRILRKPSESSELSVREQDDIRQIEHAFNHQYFYSRTPKDIIASMELIPIPNKTDPNMQHWKRAAIKLNLKKFEKNYSRYMKSDSSISTEENDTKWNTIRRFLRGKGWISDSSASTSRTASQQATVRSNSPFSVGRAAAYGAAINRQKANPSGLPKSA